MSREATRCLFIFHEASSCCTFSHHTQHPTDFCYAASPPLEALGTARMADCIGVEQMGHWGGPLAVWRLGFKHLPWNMCPHGLS